MDRIEPVRIWRDPHGGYWQAVVKRNGRQRIFSLRTKNKGEAERWFADYKKFLAQEAAQCGGCSSSPS